TSLTPIWRIASTMFWPCETRTSTCRSFATISSGLYRFLAIAVLLDVKDIPQVGPLQWGWIRGLPASALYRARQHGTVRNRLQCPPDPDNRRERRSTTLYAGPSRGLSTVSFIPPALRQRTVP